MKDLHKVAGHIYTEGVYSFEDTLQQPSDINGGTQYPLVIVFNKKEKELTSNEHALLSNILKACKVNMAQVMLINIQYDPINKLKLIQQVYQPKYLIGFGVSRAMLGITISAKPYTNIQFLHCNMLFAHSLALIESDKQKKMLLWQCLQQLFQLN